MSKKYIKKTVFTINDYWKYDELDGITNHYRYSIKKLTIKLFRKIFNNKKVVIDLEFLSKPKNEIIIECRINELAKIIADFFSKLKIKKDYNLIIEDIKTFDQLFYSWKYKNLEGGIGYNNGLFLYCFTKALDLKYVVESGVWRGFSTYILDNATKKNVKINCYDINFDNLIWKSSKAHFLLFFKKENIFNNLKV